ncbi:hypothetical protein HUZ36_08385 [Pseudoalteromonas sp. McH1-7]|uniref:DUF4144 family protein n=1 Tax=unclassified Pseudoalteromonas TaxID=194690 RepID=UPI000FFF2BB1|nr:MULTISPECIES: DUF4144 family protein [unclassified Pseudoalteromonas]NUZ10795.1 hypothetical protein [Pseudoalteromonas sp. McH1-7]RXF02796.1 hypothetical protein D9603_09975 [Pseudoalteromonas sp. PS5]USD28114.1 hypothetical protein J8Z24_14525 [Pseudoalteromonas sp. SCSIO 43201]
MTIKNYPILLVLDQSIELIEDDKALSDSIHMLDDATKSNAVVIASNGSCTNLQGHVVDTIELPDLTSLVQQYLIDEGQCCVSKIQLQSVQQAFALLK